MIQYAVAQTPTKARRAYFDLSIEDLSTLSVIADHKSFTRAAGALGTRQATLSKRVQRLEQNFRVALVQRNPKGVMLTEAGTRLCGIAQQLEHALEVFSAERTGADARLGGVVHLGTLATVGTLILPDLLRAFREKHPKTRVIVHEALPEKLEHDLFHGAIDLAITVAPLMRTSLVSARLWYESYVLVAPKAHPVADLESPVDITTLLDQTFIVAPAAPSLFALQALCKKNDVPLLLAHVSDNLESFRRSLENNVGLALLPRIALSEIATWNAVVKELKDAPIKRNVVLASRGKNHLSSAARQLHAALHAGLKLKNKP